MDIEMNWIANIMFHFGALGMLICAMVMLVGVMFGGRWA